jgi:hypothetical protein
VGPANAPSTESIKVTNNLTAVWVVNAGAFKIDTALDYAGINADVTIKIDDNSKWIDLNRSAQTEFVSVNEDTKKEDRRRTRICGLNHRHVPFDARE